MDFLLNRVALFWFLASFSFQVVTFPGPADQHPEAELEVPSTPAPESLPGPTLGLMGTS